MWCSGVVILCAVKYLVVTVCSSSSSSSSGSSTRSSQDRLLNPFAARSWPEAFHATFIHNTQRKGEERIEDGEEA